MDNGLIHVYTGDGKGKTTASMGLAVRAAGANKKVYIIQFLKGNPTSEMKIFENLGERITLFRFEKPRGFVWNLSQEEKNELLIEVAKAFDFATEVIMNRECDVIILDEIMGAISNNFIDLKRVVELLKNKSKEVEVILTGRNVPQEIIEVADYVSEINCIKHPFQKGIAARKGIEY